MTGVHRPSWWRPTGTCGRPWPVLPLCSAWPTAPSDSALQSRCSRTGSSWSRSGEWWPRSGPTTCRRTWTACSPTWTTATGCGAKAISTQTAAEHGVAPEVGSPGRSVWATPASSDAPAHDGTLEALPPCGAAERAYLDTWTAVAGRSRPTRPTMPGSRTGAGRRVPHLCQRPRPGPGRARRDAIAGPDRPPGRALRSRRPVRAGLLGDVLERPGMAGLSQHLFTLEAAHPGAPTGHPPSAGSPPATWTRRGSRSGWSRTTCSCWTMCGCSPLAAARA